jgi:chromosome segregation ATPase
MPVCTRAVSTTYSAEQISKERRSRLEEQLSAADKREYQLQMNLTDAEHKLYVSQLEQQSAQKALTATQTTVDNLKEHLRDARSQISRTLSDAGRVQDALVASTSLSASLSHDLAALKVRISSYDALLCPCAICGARLAIGVLCYV